MYRYIIWNVCQTAMLPDYHITQFSASNEDSRNEQSGDVLRRSRPAARRIAGTGISQGTEHVTVLSQRFYNFATSDQERGFPQIQCGSCRYGSQFRDSSNHRTRRRLRNSARRWKYLRNRNNGTRQGLRNYRLFTNAYFLRTNMVVATSCPSLPARYYPPYNTEIVKVLSDFKYFKDFYDLSTKNPLRSMSGNGFSLNRI